jgi:hypothetical protein
MSEISSNSKSPRGLFQIRKKKKKIASKKILDQTFKNNEEQIMMELLRLSQKSENGICKLIYRYKASLCKQA